MNQVIEKIKKSDTNEIWVALSDFTGSTKLDLREYYYSTPDDKYLPTRKGIAFPLDVIPDVSEALEKLSDIADIQMAASFTWTEQGEVRASNRKFNKNVYAELRYFYLDANGDHKPTNKGITFKSSIIPLLLDAILAAEEYLDGLKE